MDGKTKCKGDSKAPNEKFKWCFIGTGSLAKTVAAQLNKSGRHEIISYYTRNYQKGWAGFIVYKKFSKNTVES